MTRLLSSCSLQRVLHSMLTGRILLEIRDAVQDSGDNGPKHGRDGVSKMSTMNFAPRDEKNRRPVADGLSFDVDQDGPGVTDSSRSMSEMFGDEGTGGLNSGGDIESRPKARAAVSYILHWVLLRAAVLTRVNVSSTRSFPWKIF